MLLAAYTSPPTPVFFQASLTILLATLVGAFIQVKVFESGTSTPRALKLHQAGLATLSAVINVLGITLCLRALERGGAAPLATGVVKGAVVAGVSLLLVNVLAGLLPDDLSLVQSGAIAAGLTMGITAGMLLLLML